MTDQQPSGGPNFENGTSLMQKIKSRFSTLILPIIAALILATGIFLYYQMQPDQNQPEVANQNQEENNNSEQLANLLNLGTESVFVEPSSTTPDRSVSVQSNSTTPDRSVSVQSNSTTPDRSVFTESNLTTPDKSVSVQSNLTTPDKPDETPIVISQEINSEPEVVTAPEELEEISTPRIIRKIAAPGEGVTNLARRALATYLEENQDISLSKEQKIFVEDYLKDKTGQQPLETGQTIEFDRQLINQAVELAQNLTVQQLEVISQFSPLVSGI